MYVVNSKNIRGYELKQVGAKGVTVKYLLHKQVGAKKLQFRLFTIEKGGHTALEAHAHEHEVYVLQGKALVRGGNREVIVTPGDVLFIPSFEVHQFKNIGNKKFEFLCTKETRFVEIFDLVTRIIRLITRKST